MISSDPLGWTRSKKVGKLRAVAKKRPERTLGQVLTDARDDLEDPPSFEQIARRLESHGVSISFQTVINYHDDAVKKPDVEIVLALVAFYGLRLGDLPEEIRRRCEALRDRLVASSRQSRPKADRYAPRDSNPEPADLGHIIPNSVTSDLIAQPDQAVVAA